MRRGTLGQPGLQLLENPVVQDSLPHAAPLVEPAPQPPPRCNLTSRSRIVEYGLHSKPAIPLMFIPSFLILAACSPDLSVPSLYLPIIFSIRFRCIWAMNAEPSGSLRGFACFSPDFIVIPRNIPDLNLTISEHQLKNEIIPDCRPAAG